jgi:hypothetical protein
MQPLKNKNHKAPADYGKKPQELKLETKIEIIEQRIKENNTQMASSNIDLDELNKLYQKDLQLNQELDCLMAEWVMENT